MTVAAGLDLTAGGVESAADLSCGNGSVLAAMPAKRKFYGDFAKGWEFTGPIEKTIDEIPLVDLFICTETIEHLDDPDTVLKAIGAKSRMLLLSTPINAWDDGNLEHYWSWDREVVEEMLTGSGFAVTAYRELRPSYHWGIWSCVA